MVQFRDQAHLAHCHQGNPCARYYGGERSKILMPSDPSVFHLDLLDTAGLKNAPGGGERLDIRGRQTLCVCLHVCRWDHSRQVWPCVGPRQSVFPVQCHRKQLERADNRWTLSSWWCRMHTAHESLQKALDKYRDTELRGKKMEITHTESGTREKVCVRVSVWYLQVYTLPERSHLEDAAYWTQWVEVPCREKWFSTAVTCQKVCVYKRVCD